MRKIPVIKMSGTGNDFLMVDNRTGWLKETELKPLTINACRRRVSAGADGVIFLEAAHAPGHDYRMRLLNADGTEAEMCGNGSRCAAVFAKLVGAAGDEQHVETLAGSLHAVIAPNGRFARVRLSLPSEMKHYPQLDLGGEKDDVWLLDTGVPHAVRFVGDVAAVDIVQAGPILRRHPALGPRGANADFVQLLPGNDIRIRTFERGVEGETLACGTGAAACAIVSALAHGRRSPVRVQVASGDVLTIHFTLIDKTHAAEPYLEGAVKTVYAGEFFWE